MTFQSMLLAYPVKLETEGGSSVLVSFPDVPEALTEGSTEQEALTEAKDCLIVALDGYIKGRREIPKPSTEKTLPLVVLPATATIKITFYRLSRAVHEITRRRVGQPIGDRGRDNQASAKP